MVHLVRSLVLLSMALFLSVSFHAVAVVAEPGVRVEVDLRSHGLLDALTVEVRQSETFFRQAEGVVAAECTDARYTRYPDKIVLWEEDAETGCASVRSRVDVPEGARTVTIAYQRRLVDAQGDAVPAEQGVFVLRVWDGRYAGELAEQEDRSRLVWEGPVAPDGPGPHEIVVGFDPADLSEPWFELEWWFQDLGQEAPDGERRVAGRGAYIAELIEPTLRFGSVPVGSGTPRVLDTSAIGQAHQTRFALDLDLVPPRDAFPSAVHNATLGLPPQSHDVVVAAPDGTALAAGMFGLEGRSDATRLSIGPDAFASHGNGTYRVTYTRDLPVEATAQGHLWALPLMLAALAATGTYAWGRTKGGLAADTDRRDRRRVVLPAAFFAATALAVMALAVGDHYRFIAAWPMPRLGIAYLAGFGLVALVGATLATRDRRRRLRSLEEAKASTETAAAELRMFLQGVTHDMKTPLIALRWLTDDLNEEIADAAEDAASRETLGRITQNVAGMERLVEDLLVLAEVETADVGTEAVSVPALVAEVRRAVDEERVRRGVAVEAEGGPVDVEVHAAHLRMALQNLVLNALKYGRQDGGHVRLSWRADDDRVVFEVADDGPGIPDDEKGRVLAVFRRGTAAAESGERGTGLGLAIVAKAVDRHGGRLEVLDAPEGGALFRFSMPRA